jgi:DNA-binding response OmpR family regulator
MAAMAWALTDNGFDVEVVSKRAALEFHSLEGPDVAIFNMSATAEDKSAYNRQLRMLNPDVIIIDVDEFVTNEGSVRDSGADSYSDRPSRLEDLTRVIRELSAKSHEEREGLRRDAEAKLRSDREPARDDPGEGSSGT